MVLRGPPGVGKSELALELITRGNGLVADDVTELYRISPDTLEGRCPELLRDFLEVRGLGVLNIRTMFGETAVRRKKSLKLIVHLHRPHSVAAACLADVDPDDVLPPIAAYSVMRVGRLPLLPYYPPGDAELAAAVGRAAVRDRAVLLSNHGPVVAGKSLDAAVYSAEELEETAKLYLMLRQERTRLLTDAQVAQLRERFPS